MSATGVDGKWHGMVEERNQLREKVTTLTGQNEELKTKVDELIRATPSGMVEVMAERDVLRARVIELQRAEPSTLISPDEGEQRALDLLQEFMGMLRGWGLRSNVGEMAAAVHVLQGFVIQHMLQRLSSRWGEWFDPEGG